MLPCQGRGRGCESHHPLQKIKIIMTIPKQAVNLLEKGEIYLATSNQNQPNVTITESGKVIAKDKLLIADVAMTLAKDNIIKNPNCCIAVYDNKMHIGYKAFGSAQYSNDKKYLDIAKKRLGNGPYEAKGAVVITIKNIFIIQ